MRRTLAERIFSFAVLLPFLAAIGYMHYSRDVPLRCFIYGSGSWGFGCILKLVLYHGVIRRLRHDPSGIRITSVLNGVVSGVTELGLAFLFFVLLPILSFWEVVAFGVGIGTIEALLVATSSNLLKEPHWRSRPTSSRPRWLVFPEAGAFCTRISFRLPTGA